MKKHLLCIILLFLTLVILWDCTSMSAAIAGNPQEDNNYKIELVEYSMKMTVSFWVHLSFEGYDYLKKQEEKSAETKLRQPDYSDIPKCGIIVIQLNSHAIEGAQGKWYVYIIRDKNDKEILRITGDTNTPDYKISDYSTRWYAYDMVPIDTEVVFPLKVRIASKVVTDEFYDFLIEKKE